MENRINVADLLKDCPKGMELYSTIYGTVYFDGVRDTGYAVLIDIKTSCNTEVQFYPDGKFNTHYSDSEMTLFPSKDVRTWEGFVPPCKFNDGDILATDLGSVFFLNTRLNTDEYYGCYAGIGGDGSFHICEPFAYKECCGLATEGEKAKLFKAIKDNGYRWNEETKNLEVLIKPNKEEAMKEKVEQITLDIPNGYEFFGINDDNKVVLAKKQHQYPKTYDECCKVLFTNSIELGKVLTSGYNCELLKKLGELLICRDAYWMIAGDWKFDFDKSCYYLCNEYGSVQKFSGTIDCSAILTFPTEEMRDAFYENFKELIESCKELL